MRPKDSLEFPGLLRRLEQIQVVSGERGVAPPQEMPLGKHILRGPIQGATAHSSDRKPGRQHAGSQRVLLVERRGDGPPAYDARRQSEPACIEPGICRPVR